MSAPGALVRLCGPDDGQRRESALKSAIALRNCARGPQSTASGRRTIRTLMREQALKWRRPRGPALAPAHPT